MSTMLHVFSVLAPAFMVAFAFQSLCGLVLFALAVDGMVLQTTRIVRTVRSGKISRLFGAASSNPSWAAALRDLVAPSTGDHHNTPDYLKDNQP